jgi:hypothetical protein
VGENRMMPMETTIPTTMEASMPWRWCVFQKSIMMMQGGVRGGRDGEGHQKPSREGNVDQSLKRDSQQRMAIGADPQKIRGGRGAAGDDLLLVVLDESLRSGPSDRGRPHRMQR